MYPRLGTPVLGDERIFNQ